jgi:hypothetical protein
MATLNLFLCHLPATNPFNAKAITTFRQKTTTYQQVTMKGKSSLLVKSCQAKRTRNDHKIISQ